MDSPVMVNVKNENMVVQTFEILDKEIYMRSCVECGIDVTVLLCQAGKWFCLLHVDKAARKMYEEITDVFIMKKNNCE